jgi:hypothetical protein
MRSIQWNSPSILLAILLMAFSLFFCDAADARQTNTETSANQTVETNSDGTVVTTTDIVAPGQSFVAIRAIPRKTRAIYAGIAIGALLLLVIGLRLVKKRS